MNVVNKDKDLTPCIRSAEIPSLDWVIKNIPRNQLVRGNFELANTVPLINEL